MKDDRFPSVAAKKGEKAQADVDDKNMENGSIKHRKLAINGDDNNRFEDGPFAFIYRFLHETHIKTKPNLI